MRHGKRETSSGGISSDREKSPGRGGREEGGEREEAKERGGEELIRQNKKNRKKEKEHNADLDTIPLFRVCRADDTLCRFRPWDSEIRSRSFEVQRTRATHLACASLNVEQFIRVIHRCCIRIHRETGIRAGNNSKRKADAGARIARGCATFPCDTK